MATIQDVRELAATTIGPENTDTWLVTPTLHLQGRSPQIAIDEGDIDDVIALINMIENGVSR